MRKNSAPTIDMVAAKAGVGRGTVSRVINGSRQVSEKARKAVERAIGELGYVPNQAARTLVTQRTDTVALVITASAERLWAEPYFAGIIQGISRQLNDAGLHLMLTLASTKEERAKLETYLLSKHVDGALMISLHAKDPLPKRLYKSGLPVVLCGAPLDRIKQPYVDSDNVDGARQAVAHLASRGRRRIATIAGPQDMSPGRDRLTGYRDALSQSGIAIDEDLIELADFSETGGLTAMRNLLERAPDVDGVFVASDPMAFGAMRALRDNDRLVPEDVGIVGFDDSPLALHTYPPLTTVNQPVESMGREMAKLLVAQIREEKVPSNTVVLPTRLVVRDSS
ncbi:MAG: LacI family DNA-binding transcriptional regulator [Stackebrandtia sp.]